MRIVHLSDIHVGRIPRSLRALVDKRAFGAVNHLLRRSRQFHVAYLQRALAEIAALHPELVVCTGDITSVGSPEELEAACNLLEPLRATFGPRFVFLPGNHDAYVTAPDCREALARAFDRLNGGRWSLDDLPLEWQVSGLRLLLVNAATPVSCVLSSGRLTPATLTWLAARLEAPRSDNECRVVVSHFPLRQVDGQPLSLRRRMAGADALWDHLRAGRLDLVLCGHVHTPFARWEADGRGEVCAGSLTLQGCFSVLEWTPGTRRFRQFFVDVSTPREPTVPAIDDSLVAPVS